MKIGLVIKQVSLSVGGAERFALNFAGTMAREGHDVHILASSWDREIPGVRYHRVAARRKPGWLNILQFHGNCRKILDRQTFDIVYGLTQFHPQDVFRMGGGIYAQWLRVRYPNPFSRWAHYLIRPTFLVNLYMERKIFQPGNFLRVVGNSEKCKEELIRFYRVRPEQVDVVYNGVDHSVFHPGIRDKLRMSTRADLGVREDQKLLLYAAASNWKRKGLDTLLKALIPLEGFLLIVVGKDKEPRYRKKVLGWGIESKVRFLGFQKDIEAFYAAADFLVLPTLYDPFSNVCLEAMACGLPVITSTGNGASEILRHGVNGFVLQDAKDPLELRRVLETILLEDSWEDMGKAAYRTSLDFTLEKNVADTLAVCRRALREKSGFKVLSLEGIRWHHVSPGGPPRLKQWSEGTLEVEVVKSSPMRQTVRHAPGVILKEGLYSGTRAILRTVGGAKACREGSTLLKLARRGIPVPEVLAYGTQKRSGILERDILLTREVPGAQNLNTYVKRDYPGLPFRTKRELIRKFAGFIRELHDAGVDHRDLHIGNILLRDPGSDNPFVLLDADRIRLKKQGLSLRERVRNLALLLLNFWTLSSRAERLRFARDYGLDTKDLQVRDLLDRLEAITLDLAGKVWDGKTRRCLSSNARFRKHRQDAFRILRVNRSEAEAVLKELLPDPDRLFGKGTTVKEGRTTKSCRVEVGDRAYFLKRYNRKGWFYSLRNALRRCRAVRSWLAAWNLLERGVPVPEPILCLEERKFRLLKRSYLVSEYIGNARGLPAVWPETDAPARRTLLARLAVLLGRMHRAGVIHGDLKWSNILLPAGPGEKPPVLCDTDGTRVLRSRDPAPCRKDLDRFLRDLDRQGGPPEERRFFESVWTRWSGA
ncbi:MAG TPA: lipopolysaccharide kinase InaA family protein, partial [Syntrophobacteraceae bacterium]|nr:lipopolysaccharide kinase InaA family protein [Syntrophobacteraceae bacterium]